MPFPPDSDTRTRILEAAWSLVERRGVGRVTMADVAGEVGISRQAVYLHFGDRAGLLLAMVRHRDATSPGARRLRRLREAPPRTGGFEAYLRAWCRYLPVIAPVARALAAAAVTDEAARAAFQDRMALLRQGIQEVLERAAATGRLASGWSVEEAAAWCWAQMHPETRHLLVDEAGWSARQYEERLVTTTVAVLLRKAEPGHDGGRT